MPRLVIELISCCNGCLEQDQLEVAQEIIKLLKHKFHIQNHIGDCKIE